MGIKQSDIERAIADGNRVLAQLKRVCPYPHELKTDRKVSCPQPEPAVQDEPLAAGQGAASRPPRIVVSVTSFRVRLLDPDNLCPKSLVDGLRYSGLIPDDRPQDISLTVAQELCAKGEERTEIELILP